MNEPIKFEKTDQSDREKVELFSIDDTAYYVERKPRVNVALRYLKMVREQGQEVAIAFLLEQMLGTEGFEALCDYDDLTEDQFQQVVLTAQKIALGGLEAPKG